MLSPVLNPVAALAPARSVADATETGDLDALVRRWQEHRLRVLVAGEAKRGKSTLVNALLGRPALPTGVIPVTAVATTVVAADPGTGEGVEGAFLDGHTEAVPLAGLAAFVTEDGNPDNRRAVREVTVRVAGTWLTGLPVEVVDAPGVGSVHAHNTEQAQAALATLDAVVVVLSVDPPISAAELDLLRAVTAQSVATFVVANKADRHTPAEVAQSVAFTQQVCAQALGRPIPVQVCSATRGLDDPGFAAFAQTLQGWLRAHAAPAATTALTGHTRTRLQAMASLRRVRCAALEAQEHGRAATVAVLRTRLDAIAGQRAQLRARLDGSLRDLRRRLDAGAAASVRPAADAGHDALTQAWPDLVARTAPSRLEQAGRDVIAAALAAHVDTWRADRARWREEELAAIAAQTGTDLAAQVELARQAVGEALGLEVSTAAAAPRLPPGNAFRYDFAKGPNWELLPLPGAAAVLGSPTSRRRRIERRLHEAVGPLADRQLGRARADLQTRLDEAGRALARALEAYLRETVGRLQHALAPTAAPAPAGQGGNTLDAANPAPAPADEAQVVRAQADLLERLAVSLSATQMPHAPAGTSELRAP